MLQPNFVRKILKGIPKNEERQKIGQPRLSKLQNNFDVKAARRQIHDFEAKKI